MEFLVGGLGFVLFFLYDWNRVFWKRKVMSRFFLFGCIGQLAAGVSILMTAWLEPGRGGAYLLLPAFLFLGALIYTLFFALPFDSTYCKEADEHKVCRSGIYGWCRHPGIWWFFGCFLCMGLACEDKRKLWYGLGLSFLNLLYAWYQDRFIFPREFSDYEDYRQKVPFLVPHRRSRSENGGECG